MDDRVFKLWEIPLSRPAVLASAFKHLDLEALRRSLELPYSPQVLRHSLDHAVATGGVRSVRADVPSRGVRRFVDLETLQGEFEAYLKQPEARAALASDGGPDDGAADADGGRPSFWQAIIRAIARRTALRRLAERLCFRPDHYVTLGLNTTFAPIQVHEEIASLLALLSPQPPRSVLEIGSSRGGTLYLFTKVADPAAVLVSVDLKIPDPDLLRSFARDRQEVFPLQGDSTAPSTIDAVRKLLPDPIDFLFLDGDHSYDGVRRDFENYAPLVSARGLIALHDIVEDNKARYGVLTGGWAGEVPRFWSELKRDHEHVEFVHDHAQDACGIGVVFMPGRSSRAQGPRA